MNIQKRSLKKLRDNEGDKHGLIDEDGKVILPCEYEAPWNGIHPARKRIVFRDGSNEGLKDYEGNIIIPADYCELRGIDEPLITVRVECGEESNQYIAHDGEHTFFYEGLVSQDGEEVIPPEYQTIRWIDEDHFVCCREGLCEMYSLAEQKG